MPGNCNFPVFYQYRQPDIARILQIFLFPTVKHSDVCILLANNRLNVCALCIECLVRIRPRARITDCFPRTHDRIRNRNLRYIRIPACTTGTQHIVFTIIFKDSRSFTGFFHKITCKTSARFQIIISQKAVIYIVSLFSEE